MELSLLRRHWSKMIKRRVTVRVLHLLLRGDRQTAQLQANKSANKRLNQKLEPKQTAKLNLKLTPESSSLPPLLLLDELNVA